MSLKNWRRKLAAARFLRRHRLLLPTIKLWRRYKRTQKRITDRFKRR